MLGSRGRDKIGGLKETMRQDSLFVAILAGGQGKRMKSSLSKVFHPLGGRPVIHHVIETARHLSPRDMVLVCAPDHPPFVPEKTADFHLAIQTPALGTGHAVQTALTALPAFDGGKIPGDLLVLFGDTPLVTPETLQAMCQHKAKNPDLAVLALGMRPLQAEGYGRLRQGEDGSLLEIIEFRDASPDVRRLPLCNAGAMLLDGQKTVPLLKNLSARNAAGELYLTEIVALARAHHFFCGVVEGPWEEFLGINTREDLAVAEQCLQQKWRAAALQSGVTLLDPTTVYFSFDTQLSPDVTVHPCVSFGPGVVIGEGAIILPFCRLEQTHVGPFSKVGPFCHLREGTRLEERVQIGNFVEAKKSHFLKEAKTKHLAYVGDTHVGERSNIGAGTITCNFDGYQKSSTWIGDDVFIGSNTALIAPVRIEDHSLIGAGSVITKDVPPKNLALGRSPQQNKPRRFPENNLT